MDVETILRGKGRAVATIGPDETVAAAVNQLASRNIGALVVSADGESVDGIISEMRRVTWPSREEWVGATLLTIALVVLVGVFTSACDWIFANLFTLVTGTAH